MTLMQQWRSTLTNPDRSKYKYVILAIERLEPGEGLKIVMDAPWGLATFIYRRKREARSMLYAGIKQRPTPGCLYVWREPKWKELQI